MSSEAAMSWEQAVSWLRAQPGSQELVRACFFDDPLIDAAARYWRSTEWCAVRAYLPSIRGRALDVGAGRGIASYALARDGWSVTALEPDASDLVGAGAIRALAQDSGVAIEIVETWGEKLPFPNAGFDLVHCRQVLHHARNLDQLCREIGRVLKPGGTFIATREHVISKKEDLAGFQAGHPLHRLYGGENAFLLREYIDAIRDAGIVLRRIMNGLETDINFFPESIIGLRGRVEAKIGLRIPIPILRAALKLRGNLSDTPGRLYAFVGHKSRRGPVA
jgi:SAM-dependent methyltransferase